MISFKKFILLILILSAPIQQVWAVTNAIPQQADSSEIEVRHPSEEKLAEYTQDQAFEYSQETEPSESIIWEILNWLFSWLGDLFADETTANILEIAAYVLFISILILLVNQYLKGNLRTMMKDNKSRNELRMTMESGTSSMDHLDKLIREAIQQKQYREAICHLYSKTLRQLANKGLISWKKDKTNRDYLYELRSDNMRSLFKNVTRYYEYAEYGHFPVDSNLFNVVHQNFKQLNQLISDNGE